MLDDTLDFPLSEFADILRRTSDLIVQQHRNMADHPAYCAATQQTVADWFNEGIPQAGKDIADLLEEVKTKVLDTATGNLGPHMYSYVMSGGNQVSIAAEALATTVNQNQTKWHLGPAMTEIEKRVIAWTAELMHFPEAAGGVMVSGGSAANLTGLTVARNIFLQQQHIKAKGLFGLPPCVVYASDQVHNCVDKSVAVLGIGTDNLRKIPTKADFRIDVAALVKQIEADRDAGLRPFCLIGTAGTVNTGAIDPLDELATIARQYGLWFHVDGAYGGLASTVPALAEAYRGMERADSLALDFHKWLYQPFEAGCTLVRNWGNLRQTYFAQAEYLDAEIDKVNERLEFNEHTFQLSRNAKAFKVWMSLKAYGFPRIRRMIEKDLELTRYLAEQVEQAADFEVVASDHLAVLCFRYRGDLQDPTAIIALNERMVPAIEADGRVFITGTRLKGEFALRACLINHRKSETSIDYLLAVVRDIGSRLDT